MHLNEFIRSVPSLRDAAGRRLEYSVDELPAFADRLQIDRPRNVRAVIALSRQKERRQRQWLRLVTITSGRQSEFALIQELAKSLAETALETGTVPVIVPISDRTIELLPQDATVAISMRRRGVLLYERNHAEA
jgi:hypothetical protein